LGLRESSLPLASIMSSGRRGSVRLRASRSRVSVRCPLIGDGAIPGLTGWGQLPHDDSGSQKRGEWCGRGDSNPHGISPNGFSYRLRLSPPRVSASLRSGLSLHRAPNGRGVGAARLVSTPSRLDLVIRPGLARDRHLTGFPEFEQFYSAGFPAGTQELPQVRCVYHSATPAEAR